MWHEQTNYKDAEACALASNASDLTQECAWLAQAIETRIGHYFEQGEQQGNDNMPPAPELMGLKSPYALFVVQHSLTDIERLLIVMALAPTIKPQLFDIFLSTNELTGRPFTEFGMVEHAGSLLATGATAAFVMSAMDLQARLNVLEQLQNSPNIQKVLSFDTEPQGTSLLSAPLVLKPEFIQQFTTGAPYRPESNHQFPATYIKSNVTWDEVTLSPIIKSQLNEIVQWVKHGPCLMQEWKIGKRLRPGYRALFYGPPGTGKTLTASLLGDMVNMDVYKIDLSMVTSKYIGETEKNLEQVFSLAEDRRWILFFDEADALFGKRLNTGSANDQFANQNVAYLLQRIERFNGVVILASNYKDNIDNAFFRRFESIIHFAAPKAEERLALWQNGFCEKTRLSPSVNLEALAEQYPLSGADIVNVIRYVSLTLLSEGRAEVLPSDIQQGISRISEHKSPPRW
ncbi:ATP-binding protein [Alteromonadaceae bacterium M269]|nr:ATP-binding protein [Alteromonadaceae bacterium M269]